MPVNNPNPSGSGLDGGLAAALAPILNAPSSSPLSGSQTGSANSGEVTVSQLQALLAMTGAELTGRESLTPHALVGPMPVWVPQQAFHLARVASQQGIWDPYLGDISSSADDRVFMGGSTKVQRRNKKKTREPVGPFMMPADAGGANTLGPDTPHHRDYPDQGVDRQESHTQKGDNTLTVTQAKNQPYLWDEQRVQDTIKRMRAAGLNVNTFDDMKNNWDAMVDRASQMYSLSSGQRKVTPWDVLDMYKKELPAPGPGDPRFNGSTTQTATSVNQLTDGQAWSVLQSTLSQMLGRDPSDHELRNFAYKMNSLAAKNPSVSKTITQYKDGKAVSANTTSKGGFTTDDAAMAAYNQAQDNPDYAEYQAATTYYNAALSAIGAIGNVG